jgi:hypothetical protein
MAQLIGTAANQVPLNGMLGSMAFQDTSNYLTAEADTLATVTARGATTTVVPAFSNGATIQGLTVGKGANAVANNTAVGVGVMASGSLSGVNNTAVGYNALPVNTTGDNNVAIGQASLFANLSGYNNTAVGQAALYVNTSGVNNTSLGGSALSSNVSGSTNLALGRNAGSALTTGSNNTIIGSVAGTAGLSDTVIIAAGSAERMRIDSSGNLGIGQASPTYKLDISGNSLGTTAGNQSNVARLYSASMNADYLEITNTRTASGTSWTTAGFRFQQKIDATWMAWQQFNGGADGGIVWGAGTTTASATAVTEKMRLDASGRLSIGTVSSDSLLRVAGQIESTVTGFKFPDGTVQVSAVSKGKAIAMAMIFGG